MADLNALYASEYDSATSYAAGDRCVYEKEWYECKTATTGAFDADKWEKKYLVDYLNSNLGSKATLLWTNSNPNSKFAAQTIALNSNGYDKLLIDVKYNSSNNYSRLCLINKNNEPITQLMASHSPSNGVGIRSINALTDTQITFDIGVLIFGSTITGDDNYCIPTKIYGVNITF